MKKVLGVCPITGKEGMYVPGNWGTESIDCDYCKPRCPKSLLPDGYENDNGRYHGGACFPKNGFVIFKK